jgi:hypothetical protein
MNSGFHKKFGIATSVKQTFLLFEKKKLNFLEFFQKYVKFQNKKTHENNLFLGIFFNKVNNYC